ncbi:MAG TPA: stage II sporulation protein P [Bacillaceae bacterium]
MFKFAAKSSASIIAVFCLISIIAVSSVKVSFLSLMGNSHSKADSFLYMMSMENHSFQSVLPQSFERSLAREAFELMTNLNVTDMKTFLISEIPGLAASSPKILVAGDGTDFTNLPIESPPPPDFGLVEEEEQDPHVQPVQEKEMSDHIAFIYHSHNRESYLPLLPGVTNPNHASNKEKNVTMLGRRLGEKLEDKGIKTLVDTTDFQSLLAKRNMNYYQSYAVSREVVVETMKQNKDVQLFFDIHRDAQRKNVTTTTLNGKEYAKSLFVIGTGHPHFSKNLELAKKLHLIMNRKYPGISRGVMEKPRENGNNGIYNQDLSENALVIEIGGVDNNLEELNRTVDALADVISEYYWGEAVEASKEAKNP